MSRNFILTESQFNIIKKYLILTESPIEGIVISNGNIVYNGKEYRVNVERPGGLDAVLSIKKIYPDKSNPGVFLMDYDAKLGFVVAKKNMTSKLEKDKIKEIETNFKKGLKSFEILGKDHEGKEIKLNITQI